MSHVLVNIHINSAFHFSDATICYKYVVFRICRSLKWQYHFTAGCRSCCPSRPPQQTDSLHNLTDPPLSTKRCWAREGGYSPDGHMTARLLWPVNKEHRGCVTSLSTFTTPLVLYMAKFVLLKSNKLIFAYRLNYHPFISRAF